MRHRFVQNAEGEMLFVPQVGQHVFKTEMGWIFAEPGEIVVIPRGIKFQLDPVDGFAKGYICENFGPSFRLPELGPIGSNGLAHPRHFLSPEARFEDQEGDFELLVRFNGQLWNAQLKHHPLDVVAWHGNYAPYKYDLRLFNTINTVSFDHPDPSIFTVLTSPTDTHGVANCDFVIFPPRWMVAENTFRPPYFHRNFASEWMGLVYGEYDAKAEHASGGFVPGGASLHNAMTAHGPDATTFNKAIEAPEGPQKIDKTLAFMFESRYVFVPTDLALKSAALQKNYQDCWQGFTKYFKPETVSKK
jgi:homogentisate 1,2-dioxygenase